ncbi:MAG: NAD(P)-dependent oxidoreductase, partial [Thermoguttaceae bacterium]|nr:NAD(P)-dependent oxidoreductase [Thermoguttaceae bacterium]
MNKPKIGWIGLGVIGGACARRALDAGYELAVYSRTRAKAEPLVASGAIWRDSPREVAEISDVVFSCVGYPRDVSEIFYGENGIAAAWKNQTNARGAVYVDMTTSSPDLAAQIAADAARFGFSALDAP